MGRKFTYGITLMSGFAFIAVLIVYASIKPHLVDQEGISITFLGTIDVLHFFSRATGGIYFLLWPPKRINLAFLVCGVIQLISAFVIAAMPVASISNQVVLAVGKLIMGLSRASKQFPLFLLVQVYNRKEDSHDISIWKSTVSLGNAVGFVFAQLVLQIMNLGWRMSLISCLVFYVILCLVMYFTVDDTQQVNPYEQYSFCQKCSQLKSMLAQFLRPTSSKWFIFQFMVIDNMVLILNLWFPLYFNRLGIEYYDKIICLFLPIFMPLGAFIATKLISTEESRVKYVSFAFILLHNIPFIWLMFLGGDSVYLPQYFLIFILAGIFYGGFVGRIIGSDAIHRIHGGPIQQFYILSLLMSLGSMSAGLLNQLIGYLMDHKLQYFLYLALAVSLSMTVIYVIRKYIEAQEQKTEERNTLMQEDPDE